MLLKCAIGLLGTYSDKLEMTQIMYQLHATSLFGNQILLWQTRVNSDFTQTIWAKNCWFGALIWRATTVSILAPSPLKSIQKILYYKIDLKSQKPHWRVPLILFYSAVSMTPRWLWLEIRYGPVCAYTITYKLICAHKSMKSWQVAALHMDNLSFQQISGGKAHNYF